MYVTFEELGLAFGGGVSFMQFIQKIGMALRTVYTTHEFFISLTLLEITLIRPKFIY
jgi:hypothetical protein